MTDRIRGAAPVALLVLAACAPAAAAAPVGVNLRVEDNRGFFTKSSTKGKALPTDPATIRHRVSECGRKPLQVARQHPLDRDGIRHHLEELVFKAHGSPSKSC